MYNNKKIGVGVITCNRKDTTLGIVQKLAQANYVDDVIIVKNREYDYGDFENQISQKFQYVNIKEDVGVGFCKNTAFRTLLDSGCDHIFLVEDDTIIKDPAVFKIYIDTAEFFKLGHLVFGFGSSGQEPNRFDESKAGPYYRILRGGYALDFYFNLQGGFCYYSREALQKIGMMDDVHYINALEHVEHTFRLSMHGFYTPFWAFADVCGSRRYLDWYHDGREYSTTIEQDELYRKRLHGAFSWFRTLYNINVNQIPRPTQEAIDAFIRKRVD